MKAIQGYTNRIWSISCSPDGSMVVSSSEDKSIRLWNVETRECLRSVTDQVHCARDVVWSPNQKLLASCGEDQTVRLWDVRTGQCVTLPIGFAESAKLCFRLLVVGLLSF
ncbi:WD40 repeat domain-containing protein [Ktedonobacter racemifer]|uniref:WD40 repeat domain-containing protein n=1 Tax=Ktedonobacter racemifer TaxID=363277 RepID=UPI003B75C09A